MGLVIKLMPSCFLIAAVRIMLKASIDCSENVCEQRHLKNGCRKRWAAIFCAPPSKRFFIIFFKNLMNRLVWNFNWMGEGNLLIFGKVKVFLGKVEKIEELICLRKKLKKGYFAQNLHSKNLLVGNERNSISSFLSSMTFPIVFLLFAVCFLYFIVLV